MSTPHTEMDIQEPEGLGEDEDSPWADYPIDTLLIRNEMRTIHDVLRRIEGESFIMDPEFQRDFIWPEDKQSKLIESVLMRIPLPFVSPRHGRVPQQGHSAFLHVVVVGRIVHLSENSHPATLLSQLGFST